MDEKDILYCCFFNLYFPVWNFIVEALLSLNNILSYFSNLEFLDSYTIILPDFLLLLKAVLSTSKDPG